MWRSILCEGKIISLYQRALCGASAIENSSQVVLFKSKDLVEGS